MSEEQEYEQPLRIRLSSDCPCGTGKIYNDCCRDFHIGAAHPNTAEQLMRSRYSAFFFRNADYLFNTQHPDSREKDLLEELEQFLPTVLWRSLTILSTSKGQAEDKKGKVEFTAKYNENGENKELYEHSRFRRHKGLWKYIDGRG